MVCKLGLYTPWFKSAGIRARQRTFVIQFEHLSINGLQTRTDIAKLKEDFIKSKSDFMDMLADERQKNAAELKKVFDYIHERYDPALKTLVELSKMPEGKAALEKLQEKKQQDALVEYREWEQESKAKAEEQLEKQGKAKKLKK